MRHALLLLCLGQGCERLSSAPGPGSAASGFVLTPHPAVSTMIRARWEQHDPADGTWLTWVHEGRAMRSPEVPAAEGPSEQWILGLPAGGIAEDIVLNVRTGSHIETFSLGEASAGELPEELLEPELVAEDPRSRPEPYLLTSVDVGPEPFFGPCYAVILDRWGRIVWYFRAQGERLMWQPRVSRYLGGLLLDELTTYTFGDPGPPVLRRLTLDLSQQETTEIPGAMLAYDELPDGSFVRDERESATAFHLARTWPDGRSERLWSCEPWMAPYSSEVWACATNTTAYSPERGSVLWSTFETGLLAEIDLQSGEMIAAYGLHPDASPVSPPEAALDKPHMPSFTARGTLLVSTHDAQGRQWARELRPEPGLLREIWSIESPTYAEYGGQVQELPSGNLLWQLGTAGVVREITREGEVVWEARWEGHLVGNTTPIPDLYALLSLSP